MYILYKPKNLLRKRCNLIPLLLISLFHPIKSYAIEDAEKIEDLQQLYPTASLTKIMNATVGLRIPVTQDGKDLISNCTGVVIDKNKILTARHCVFSNPRNYEYNKTKAIEIIFVNQNPISIIPEEVGYIKNNESLQISQFREDLAIIKLSTDLFTNAVQNEEIIKNTELSNDKTGKEALSRLNDLLFTGPYHIYYSGWGSNKFFQYKETLNYSDGGIADSTYLQTNINMLSYNLDKFTFFGIQYVLNAEKLPNNVHSNTNGVFQQQKSVILQSGDSGGPVFICKQKYENCYLVGIISAGEKNIGQLFSTLVNPSFDAIFQKVD